jgi:hypothetical protein
MNIGGLEVTVTSETKDKALFVIALAYGNARLQFEKVSLDEVKEARHMFDRAIKEAELKHQ